MSISKTYLASEAENKWYPYWMEKGFFRSVPDEREPYTVVIPPPNVTGVLHMGHMLNNTIQDVLIRRARMLGKNALWVPGTDHASIATEAKVVAKLKEEGIEKNSITREEFLKYAYDWKDKYGGIILEQLKKLGASCDWERTSFTMDPAMTEAVIDTFIHLYEKGLIYRGIRMVNWDPKGLTAVSDEEVIRKEVNQKLYYIQYKFADGTGHVTIATTRPETIMADAAVCVNPNDERYKHLHGKKILVPLINKEIPIICDEYVSMDFGTGCLKVTPAHDLNDYELGVRHKLPVVDIINDNGTLNENAQILINEDRFIARKKIAVMLEEAGQLEKVEDSKSQVGFSERTDAVIEPKLSMQWFVRMEVLAKPALDAVNNAEVNLIPDKYINTYRHWMENVKDWCISRQLWWGQQIPAWYAPNGEVVVAKSAALAIEKFKSKSAEYASLKVSDLKQDEDVVDTWFSSWLWPISVFDPTIFGDTNNKGNAELNYYYPTNDLVTAPEILFFWVARMIMAGKEFRNQVPFKNVYLTGIVRDKLGRKMSKSLGNSPDPIELIEKFGADGVRVGMLLCSPAGNDLMFDESYCEQGRNFANKIWNAFRLVKGWKQDDSIKNENAKANEWFDARFNEALTEIEQLFDSYRLSEALMSIYKLIWDDFCSSYLEMIKPTYHKLENGESYQDAIDTETFNFVKSKFEEIIKLIHPFMPFLSEELWHDEELFGIREEMDCCIVAEYPRATKYQSESIQKMQNILQIVSEMRNIRNTKQIAPKEALNLSIKNNSQIDYLSYALILNRLANIADLQIVDKVVENASQFIVGNDECFVDLGEAVDPELEKEKMEKELIYLQGFLKSVDAKLSNEKFVNNAKADVVDNEKKKKADAEQKITIIKERLQKM
jgi:valyl-tRNA synthetase